MYQDLLCKNNFLQSHHGAGGLSNQCLLQRWIHTGSCHFQSAPLEPVYFTLLLMHAIIISLNLFVLTGIKWQQLQICCRLHAEKVQNGKAALQLSFYKEYNQNTTSRVSVSQMICKPSTWEWRRSNRPWWFGERRLHRCRRLAIKFGHPEVEGVSGRPLWLYLQTPTAKDVWTCLNVVFGWA